MDLPLTTAAASEFCFLESVESTNSFISSNAQTFQNFSVVASLNQTAGRGRRGREWLSLGGHTLAVSVVVPLNSASISPTWLPILSGVAVARALVEISYQQVDVKWPNDILVAGKKVGGILCQGMSTLQSIVGVGINISVPDSALPENAGSIQHPLYSFEQAIDLFVSSLVENLRGALVEVSHFSEGDLIARHYVPSIRTIGRKVLVHETDSITWSGLATGLSPEGHLIVRMADGLQREVVAADIEHLRD